MLPGRWVEAASAIQTRNPGGDTADWQQGYGFLLWRSRHGYRGDGAFGQYMVVLPEHDVVIAMFSDTDDMQAIMDLMWRHLLPACRGGGSHEADEALAAQLNRLQQPTVAERLPHVGTDLDDLVDASYVPAPLTETSHRRIRSARIELGRLVIEEEGGSFGLPLTAEWSTEGEVAVSAARRPDGGVVADVAFLNSPHRLEVVLGKGHVHATWARMPLFGAGFNAELHTMV